MTAHFLDQRIELGCFPSCWVLIRFLAALLLFRRQQYAAAYSAGARQSPLLVKPEKLIPATQSEYLKVKSRRDFRFDSDIDKALAAKLGGLPAWGTSLKFRIKLALTLRLPPQGVYKP